MSAPCVGALVLLWGAGVVGPALAQSFAPPEGAGPGSGASALLERALPCGMPAMAVEAGTTRWFGLEALETRTLAAGLRVKSFAVATGVAQTGDGADGWTSLALACGSVGGSGALALRVEARQERRDGPFGASVLARDGACDVGAGGWLALGGACRAWASATQLWTRGPAPPLARPLQFGLRAGADGAALWAAVEAPRPGGDGGRLVGGACAAGPLELWCEAAGMMPQLDRVAREYGVPAVVNVAGVTRVIRTGDRVRVDGDRGVIERLPSETPCASATPGPVVSAL